MTLVLDSRTEDVPCPEVPADWDLWDHSAFADSLADDHAWGMVPDDEAPPPAATCASSVLDTRPELLSSSEAIDFLVELQRTQSRLAALEARALVAVAGAYRRERQVSILDPDGSGERALTISDELREEIAAALHRSPQAVHDQLAWARLLAGPLSDTRRALAEGVISAQHAQFIAEQARRLSCSHVACHQSPEDDTAADARERVDFHRECSRLQELVLPFAAGTTAPKTRARARAIVASLDAEGEEKRRQQAKSAIDVQLYAEDDGLAVLFARMPIEQAVRAHAAINARVAKTGGACAATLGQLRVNALVDALCGAETGAPAATVLTEIQIVVSADAVLGYSDAPGTTIVGHDGQQPITAQAVRELLGNPDLPTTLRRLIVDPVTGHLLDRGRSSYRVTDSLRSFLVARDSTCRHPGCSRRASSCQIDHAVAWDDGGGTDRANTGPLCTRHHQLKTHSGWEIIESSADGSIVWRSPQGRTYEVPPPPVLVAPIPPPRPEPPPTVDPPF